MSFLHSWLCKQNGLQCAGPRAVNELGGPVIPGNGMGLRPLEIFLVLQCGDRP